MISDFDRGYKTAKNEGHDPSLNIANESIEFFNGFTMFMREESELAGNADLDSFDF